MQGWCPLGQRESSWRGMRAGQVINGFAEYCGEVVKIRDAGIVFGPALPRYGFASGCTTM
jgi:hypothetical protein